MNNIFILITTIIILSSCSEAQNKTANTLKEKSKDVSINKIKKSDSSYETSTKQKNIEPALEKILPKQVVFGNIEIIVSNKNEKINIKSNNEFVEEQNISLKGKLSKFFETDVDKDGFNEFYGISNTGDMFAFSSYKNKSFGKINIPKKPFDFYKDCYGVKSWEVKNNKLHLTFYNNENKLFTVRYKLLQGEASFQLMAE